MISDKTLSAAHGIVERIHGENKSAAAVPNTVLHDLVNANISTKTWARAQSLDDVFSMSDILDDSRRKDEEGNYVHDEAIEDAACIIADIVKGNHIVAKNEVIPKTLEIHELYTSLMDDRAVDIQTPAIVMPNVYHDVWSNSHLSGLVERFENIAFNEYSTPKVFPTLDEPTLHSMLKTGIESLDEDIQDWYQQLPADRLMSTYKAVFVEQIPVGRSVNPQHVIPNSTFTREDLLIIHLIAMNFEDNLPDSVNIELGELRNIMANIRSASGHAITRVFQQRERAIRQKHLVFKVDRFSWEFNSGDGQRRVISVNNDVYLDYIKAGGTPEALLGLAMLDKLESFDTILDNKESYEKTWSRRLAYHKQEIGSHIYRVQRECLQLALSRWFNEQDQETLPVDRSILHAQSKDAIAVLQPKDFEDDVNIIRCLVCDLLYSETNAKMFLDAMDAAELNDPDLEPRELALQATIDMVARWMASQIELNDL